jgi:replication-associated recombination protein RarA
MENLTVKYRPSTLGEVLGQDRVVEPLRAFVADPYSTPFLFFGESGVGKTATALALARDLGVAVEEAELGGLFEIASGMQSVEQVKRIGELLRYRPLMGSGWRVVIVNECDRMALPAETCWLDMLEHLSNDTVIIFTTNQPEKLSRRFRDRCESFHFTHDHDELRPHIQELAKRVWAEEVGGEPPDLEDLGMPTLGDFDSMHASFRLALQQLSKLVRSAKRGEDAATSRSQALFDSLAQSEADADCPHCGKAIKIKTGAKKGKCSKCGKKFEMELV